MIMKILWTATGNKQPSHYNLPLTSELVLETSTDEEPVTKGRGDGDMLTLNQKGRNIKNKTGQLLHLCTKCTMTNMISKWCLA